MGERAAETMTASGITALLGEAVDGLIGGPTGGRARTDGKRTAGPRCGPLGSYPYVSQRVISRPL